jgi:VWFA-related protein
MRSLPSFLALSGGAIFAACVFVAHPAAAQSAGAPAAQPAAQASSPNQFPSGTGVVALDIVVRDKKGKLVTDLTANDVTVLEDGAPQKIDSFRFVGAPAAGKDGGSGSAPSASGAAPGAAAAASSSSSPGRHVVLVFGRLGSNGRRLAQGAGEDFAKHYVGPQSIVSVVRIDGGIIPALDRSSDPAAVREAVRQATGLVAGAQSLPGGPTGKDDSYAGQQMGRFEGGAGAQSLSQSDSLAFVSSLASLVDGIAAERGRKTVVIFSEGFTVPPGYEQVYADLLSRANRANVSFYALDVRGLQLSAQLGESGNALSKAATISQSQRQDGSANAAGVTRSQATQDDVMLSSFRGDVVDTMAQLSAATGGFHVTQTNDFGKALARIDEDLHGYYEASYVPVAAPAAGQFHKVEVRVDRKDVRVQSRSGYYASAAAPAGATALAALTGTDLPSALDVRSRFYHFGQPVGGGPFECLIKSEVSLAKAEFKEQDGAVGRFAGKIAYAGRVLRPTGDVVETFGQDVALGGTREQVDAARAQALPLARRLRLEPGNYTAEVVVRDDVSGKAGAGRIPLTVPEPQGGLSMSSLVVVSGLDPVDPKSDPGDPLRLGDKRIVPNLGQPIAAAPGATLPIYYLVYVKPGSTKALQATVEVTREGRTVARGASPLPAPDAEGRIVGLSPIPIQRLTAGEYVVKVTVSDGSQAVQETAQVTIGS